MPPVEDAARKGESTPADVPREHDSAGALDVLPPAYRSWLPGLVRVAAALLLTVAGGLALRSLPDPGDGIAAAAPTRHAPAATRSTTTSATSAAAGTDRGSATSSQVLATPEFLAASSRTPDLHLVMLSPAGTRTTPAERAVNLQADVSDGAGGDAAAVDVVWEVRSAATGRVAFTGRGTDTQLPAGTLRAGAFAGPVEARDEGRLVVTAGRP
jgi:hypothetical protein